MRKAEFKYVFRGICAVIMTAINTFMFLYVWIGFVNDNNTTGRLLGTGNITVVTVIYIMLFVLIGHGLRAFKIGVERKTNLLGSIVLTIVTTNVMETMISVGILGMPRWVSAMVWRYALLSVAQTVIICGLALLMVDLYRKLFHPLRVLEIYRVDSDVLQKKIDFLNYKYHIEGRTHYQEPNLREKIRAYDAVLINDIPSHEKNQILKLCLDMNKRAYLVPKISDVIVRSSEQLNLIDTPLFLCRNIGIGVIQGSIKRFFDILLSLIALVITSPILVITAIAIKREDGGPVFFRQERVTKDGKRFMILKFRSMIVDAEKDGRPHPAGEKDDRITKVGRIIRSIRVDELPQLFNILKGDMSIVGPRPERVEHVEKYTEEIPEFSLRSKVKGGLTGYAQVYGKYNTSALDKLKLDLIYITSYSLLLDIQILFETVKILFQKESTEGFDEKQIKKMHDAETHAEQRENR